MNKKALKMLINRHCGKNERKLKKWKNGWGYAWEADALPTELLPHNAPLNL